MNARHGYVDESGDAGYHLAAGSSRRFVVGIVFPEQPERVIDSLLALRRRLGKQDTFEFHFRQSDTVTRTAFFAAIGDEPMLGLIAVIHKEYAPPDFRRLGKVGLYSHALASLGLKAPFPLAQCRLFLDGKGKQKQFLQQLKSNVRWACRVAGRAEQSPQDIRLLSSAHALIQCADMLTGAVAEHVNQGDVRWTKMLSSEQTLIWHEQFDFRDEEKNSLD